MAGTNKNARRHELARRGSSMVKVHRNPLPYAVRKALRKRRGK